MAQAQLRPGEETKPAAKEMQKPEQMLSNQAKRTLENAVPSFSPKFIEMLGVMLREAENVNPSGEELFLSKHKGRITMPDIGLYAVTVARGGVYDAFKSPEGQRFMETYYDRLYKDQNTGQWKISEPLAKKSEKKPPKTRLAKIVPTRRNL